METQVYEELLMEMNEEHKPNEQGRKSFVPTVANNCEVQIHEDSQNMEKIPL
jgi:hypothetical protein